MRSVRYILPTFLVLGIGVLVLINQGGGEGIRKDSVEIKAEQSGSSPESGATSRLKQAYDFLVSKGTNYGDSRPSDWTYPSYGTYMDRILFSASWEPDGDATEEDVLSGKTFYSGSNNRVQKIGTAQEGTSPGSPFEQYVQYDDAHESDYTGEESQWINTNSAAGQTVWYDTRTQTYWARSEPATKTNSFTIASCDFYTSTPRGSYGTSSTDPDCGNAINLCAVLSLATHTGQTAKTDWYLPSQKELKRAYLNGIYNQTTPAFTTTSRFWSSTEYSANSSRAWYENLNTGRARDYGKTVGLAVRCVRRD